MDFRGALEIKITFFLKFLILFKILIVSGNNFIPLCVTPNKSKKKIISNIHKEWLSFLL